MSKTIQTIILCLLVTIVFQTIPWYLNLLNYGHSEFGFALAYTTACLTVFNIGAIAAIIGINHREPY